MQSATLQRRIRRALSRTGESLRIPRSLAESRTLGVYTVHIRTGAILSRAHTLESLAAELRLIPGNLSR